MFFFVGWHGAVWALGRFTCVRVCATQPPLGTGIGTHGGRDREWDPKLGPEMRPCGDLRGKICYCSYVCKQHPRGGLVPTSARQGDNWVGQKTKIGTRPCLVCPPTEGGRGGGEAPPSGRHAARGVLVGRAYVSRPGGAQTQSAPPWGTTKGPNGWTT
jgi:hypothetical protein